MYSVLYFVNCFISIQLSLCCLLLHKQLLQNLFHNIGYWLGPVLDRVDARCTHHHQEYKLHVPVPSHPLEFIMLYNVNQKIFGNINTGSDQTDYLMKQVTRSRLAFSAVYSFSFGWKWNSYWLQNYPTWAWVDTRLLWVERRVDEHLWRIITDNITMADSSTPVSVCDK